jgi:hypothetical protein
VHFANKKPCVCFAVLPCSHVFETVDEDKAAESSKAAVEGQIKAVEQLLEELRKRRGSSS